MSTENMKTLVEAAEWAKLESAWLKAIDANTPREGMGAILESLIEADKPDLADTLAWLLLADRLEQCPPAEALDVARTVVSAVPASDELRSQAAELYRTLHGTHPHFDRLLAAAGLTGKQSPRRALRTLDTCLAIEPGRYLVNRFDDQAVQAIGYDEVMEEFNLADARGHELAMEPKKLADEFDLVDETDFRVLCQHRLEQLAELIKSDPAAVLIGLCASNGGEIDAPDLKEQLVPRHIATDKWSGWWNRARTAVRRTEQLTLEGKNPVTIVYHPRGLTLEEELAGEVAKAYTPLAQLDLLRRYVREIKHRNGTVDATFTAPLLSKLAEQADCGSSYPAEALAASLAIGEAVGLGLQAPEATYSSPGEIVALAKRPAEMTAGLGDMALWPALLAALAARADAAEQLVKLLPLAPAEQLDELAKLLAEAGQNDAVQQAVADALAEPSRHFEMCIWLWRGPAKTPPNMPGKVDLLGRLIGVLDDVHREWDVDPAHRKTVSQRLRSALSAGGYASYKAAITEMTEGVAATVKRRIERCDGLAQAVRGNMLETLKEAFYGLFVERRVQVEPWHDENTLWVTEASLLAREAEFKELIEVRMLANSRAIGEAAEHGDLSENSEWKFAVEERGRLATLATTIRGELDKARAIHPGDIRADQVGIGSRLTLKRDGDGQELEVRFLGPWDVDVDSRVFSYLSQLAQGMMGKALGDEVEVKIRGAEGTYRIETLGSALE